METKKIEIEKKFKLLDGWESEVTSKIKIFQGYYHEENDTNFTRIRLTPENKEAIICKKTLRQASDGTLKGLEEEKNCDFYDGLDLFDKSELQIYKIRHIVNFGKYTFEIDVFKSLDSELTLAEVEFENDEDIVLFNSIDKPFWLGEDVTKDNQYMNINLAKRSKISVDDYKILHATKQNKI